MIGVIIQIVLLMAWTYYCFKPEIDEWIKERINKYLE